MFATGITVVATRTPDGEPVGMTVNSFNSVSLDPPLVVWSMAKHPSLISPFETCEYYSINVLSADQRHLSQIFAARGGDKFAALEFDEGLHGIPLLHGCCARFECRNTSRYPGGDHIVFISEVVRFDREAAAPLIFHAGAYRSLEPLEYA